MIACGFVFGCVLSRSCMLMLPTSFPSTTGSVDCLSSVIIVRQSSRLVFGRASMMSQFVISPMGVWWGLNPCV